MQQTVSARLRAALDAPADPSCFQYMPEPGTATDFWNNQKPERALQKLVGKGLRITAYTGFDAERVVIPAKIGGQPVVSIGEKVFKNTTVSEVILPGSIKAILRGGHFLAASACSISTCRMAWNIWGATALRAADSRRCIFRIV